MVSEDRPPPGQGSFAGRRVLFAAAWSLYMGTSTIAPNAAGNTAVALPGPAVFHVPSAQEERPFIYVNGQMLPKNKAMVSVYDHGLLYGDGVFEGIRVYRGRIFKSKQHMDRLYKCAEAIRLQIPITPSEMVAV